jgi:hypothetical protein
MVAAFYPFKKIQRDATLALAASAQYQNTGVLQSDEKPCNKTVLPALF